MLLLSLALLGAPLPGEDGDGAMVPHSLERVSDKCHPDNIVWAGYLEKKATAT